MAQVTKMRLQKEKKEPGKTRSCPKPSLPSVGPIVFLQPVCFHQRRPKASHKITRPPEPHTCLGYWQFEGFFFFFFFPFFLSPDTDHHSERSRPGGLKVPQAIFEGLLRNKERVIWPEKLVPGGLPAKLRGSGMWGYGSDQQLSLELCMPALVGGC